MSRPIRSFIAVPTSRAVREGAAALIDALRAAGADVKWVDTQNMHLTLKFFGDVDAREIPRVCRAVEEAAGRVEPFELTVRGAGAFPKADRPRTLWLGAAEGTEAIVTLHDHVESKLEAIGFRPEHRRYQPHLTLGRVRRGGPAVSELAEIVQLQAEFEAGRMPVRELVVFSSQLERSGPKYEALGRAKLGGKK